LAQSKTLGYTNSESLVLQQSRVVRLQGAVNHSKREALKSYKRIISRKAIKSGLPLPLEEIIVFHHATLLTVSAFVQRDGLSLTSLESAAISKTRLSCASDFLSVTDSGEATYSSYKARKAGLCRIGNRGAHSWKKMLISWSETRRGGGLK